MRAGKQSAKVKGPVIWRIGIKISSVVVFKFGVIIVLMKNGMDLANIKSENYGVGCL